MTIKAEELKRIRTIEATISRNLYLLCAILTLLTMVVFSVEFFSRGEFPNLKIDILYIGVLLIYSLHKEMIRLMGKKNFRHHGEYFVYAWIIITASFYLTNFLTKNYFTSGQSQSTILSNMSIITLEVMSVFIITRAFKIIRVAFILKKR